VSKEKKRREERKREREKKKRIVRSIFLVVSIGATLSGNARYNSFILSLCQF
jgi:hypothetical protein